MIIIIESAILHFFVVIVGFCFSVKWLSSLPR